MISKATPGPNRRFRLGELLLKTGVCERDALRHAFEQKVLLGDRLGTNLLAEGLILEKDLALALGVQHNVRAAWGEVLRVDKAAVRLVKPSIAAWHNIVPHHVDDGRLYLLMMDPHDQMTRDLVEKSTGLFPVPVVVCEARMWALLREHYGVSRGLRPVPLDEPAIFAAMRAKRAAEEAKAPPESAGPELVSQEEFEALYMQHAYGAPRAEAAASVEEEPPIVQGVVEEPALLFPLPQGGTAPAEAALEAQPTVVETTLELVDEVVSLPSDELIALVERLPQKEAPRPAGGEWAHAVEATDPSAFVEPLSFEEAAERLKEAKGRDEIARIVLRYALNVFSRAALFTVHPKAVVGWETTGELERRVVKGFSLPLSERSVFSLVVESRAHYVGPLQPFKANGAWVKAAGKKLPASVALFPVLVRGRVVNLLYGDNGHGEHVGGEVGELLILAQRIADSYETLLQATPKATGSRLNPPR